jgi:hypothetical protein
METKGKNLNIEDEEEVVYTTWIFNSKVDLIRASIAVNHLEVEYELFEDKESGEWTLAFVGELDQELVSKIEEALKKVFGEEEEEEEEN